MASAFNNSINISSSPFIPVLNFFFNHIYLLLLVIVGCIGNTFVIIIFGQRAFRTTIQCIGSTMSVYPFLFYMAISDTLYLFILFCLWLSNYMNVLHRQGICQITLYLTYVCNFINAYYTIAFTAQRLIAVINPIRVSHFLSWYRSRCLALSIIIFACVIYSYIPFLVGIVGDKCLSYEERRWINQYMDIIDCIIVFLIPYIVIITMNTIIVISLNRLKYGRQEFLFQSQLQFLTRRELTRRNASRKMTKLLLTVSTSYLIICAPYACIHTWRLLAELRKGEKSILVSQLETYAHFIYHTSFAMNFYLYIVFGSKFRRELKRIYAKTKQNLSHYFHEKNFFEHDNQSELTDKHSTLTVEFTFDADTNVVHSHTSNTLLNYCCCCQYSL